MKQEFSSNMDFIRQQVQLAVARCAIKILDSAPSLGHGINTQSSEAISTSDSCAKMSEPV